ncbi:MAG: phosphoglycerate kinase [Phycisphaerae bacterium]|nr:phosphoglycerate kinase [Phycisphaerae bacterium]MCZ2400473.1 phosphoglycerate kinase [Phycisphaerae bacterium]NUQ49449.1 phosphoglycerate kinase [Phycisphaerae bacterium]
MKRTVRQLDLAGRRVLIRADFNVPLDEQLRITDDRRIRQFLPTLDHVVRGGGRAILMSHLGRPSGDREKDQRFSLRPVARQIETLTGRPCAFASDCAGPSAEEAVAALRDGQVLLLENLRFHKEETLIDKAAKNPGGALTPEQDEKRDRFARALAALGDAYVNDAFGTCHRNHVSMYDVPRLMPAGRRAMGFLVERELRYLGEALQSPRRPFVAVLGGAKVSDKIAVIRSLAARVDFILIGGAMTYTFWEASGIGVGKSLCERDKLDLARELIALAGPKLRLPTDSVAAAELRAGIEPRVVKGGLPTELMGLDIGPETVAAYSAILRGARTIVWNGPVGAFETPPFEAGTFALARAIAEATEGGATSVIGGGDSAAAVERAGLSERVTHVSTGGGASLQFLEGERFGPIEVLDDV